MDLETLTSLVGAVASLLFGLIAYFLNISTPLRILPWLSPSTLPGSSSPVKNESAKRDYMLFGAGVVVSTAIAVVIQVFM